VAADYGDPRHAEAPAGKGPRREPQRDARLASILSDALPLRINDFTEERGTCEDWVEWALDELVNGRT